MNGEYSKTPEGNLFYALRGAISEFEKAKITERMCRGRRERQGRGGFSGTFRSTAMILTVSRALIINPREAEVVNKIYHWMIDPPPDIRGIAGIARRLTEQNVPTKRGAKRWHRQVVRQMLSNRTYIGEFYQNKWDTSNQRVRLRPREEWILIPCPAIIDSEIFTQVQQILSSLSVNSRS